MRWVKDMCCRGLLALVCGVCVLLAAAPYCAADTPVSPEIIGPCWVVEVVDGATLSVRLPDDQVEQVRYMGIDAPEPANEILLGREAHEVNVELTADSHVWLEVEPAGEGYLRHAGQLLAYVFADEERTELLQEELLLRGLALLDKRNLVDRELFPGAFRVRYADRLIAAQITAVMSRSGLWELPAFFPERDLLIAAVRFWGDVEVVYLVNRGDQALDLAGPWRLLDRSAYTHFLEGRQGLHVLEFSGAFGPSCFLQPGGVLSILTGPGISEAALHTLSGCGTGRALYRWTRRYVWANAGDKAVLLGPDDEVWCRLEYPAPWEE